MNGWKLKGKGLQFDLRSGENPPVVRRAAQKVRAVVSRDLQAQRWGLGSGCYFIWNFVFLLRYFNSKIGENSKIIL